MRVYCYSFFHLSLVAVAVHSNHRHCKKSSGEESSCHGDLCYYLRTQSAAGIIENYGCAPNDLSDIGYKGLPPCTTAPASKHTCQQQRITKNGAALNGTWCCCGTNFCNNKWITKSLAPPWATVDKVVTAASGGVLLALLVALFVFVVVDRARRKRQPHRHNRHRQCSFCSFALSVLLIFLQAILSVVIEISYWVPTELRCKSADFKQRSDRTAHWLLLRKHTGIVPEFVKYLLWPMAVLTLLKTVFFGYYLTNNYPRKGNERAQALVVLCVFDFILGSVWIGAAICNIYAIDVWLNVQEIGCDIHPTWWSAACYVAILVGLIIYIEIVAVLWLLLHKRKIALADVKQHVRQRPEIVHFNDSFQSKAPSSISSSMTSSLMSSTAPTPSDQKPQSSAPAADPFPLIIDPHIASMISDYGGASSRAILKLTNIDALRSVAYRVLVNVPTNYTIKPDKGVLEPYEDIEIEVTCTRDLQCEMVIKEHVLMISSLRLDKSAVDAIAVWKSPSSYGRMQYQKVAVVFVPESKSRSSSFGSSPLGSPSGTSSSTTKRRISAEDCRRLLDDRTRQEQTQQQQTTSASTLLMPAALPSTTTAQLPSVESSSSSKKRRRRLFEDSLVLYESSDSSKKGHA